MVIGFSTCSLGNLSARGLIKTSQYQHAIRLRRVLSRDQSQTHYRSLAQLISHRIEEGILTIS
jgi:hypothetical protein